MNKNRLIFLFVIFCIVETVALVYLFLPTFLYQQPPLKKEIRIGIVPDKPEDVLRWSLYFERLNIQYKNCRFVAVISDNRELIATGLLNDTLDIIYTDPLVYCTLAEKYDLRPWFSQRVSELDRQQRHSAILSMKKLAGPENTRGMRLTFSSRNSMFANQIPYLFLQHKLQVPLRDWFSGIQIMESPEAAFRNLIEGKTDLITCDPRAFSRLKELDPEQFAKTETVWTSRPLPENLFYSKQKLLQDRINILELILKDLDLSSNESHMPSSNQLLFEPITYTYKENLESFRQYITAMLQYSKENLFGGIQ